MLEIFAGIILLISFIGMGAIISRKIPLLAELKVDQVKPKYNLAKRGSRIEKIRIILFESLLQKILSRTRVLILKTDRKTSVWLAKLRQKSIEKKKNFKDNYWQQLKKK